MKKTNWFNLMWQNGYVIAFFAFTALIAYIIFKREAIIAYSGSLAFSIGVSIPLLGLFFIVWFGFIRFWKNFQKMKKYYEENVKKE